MTTGKVYIDGELHLSLETVAELYQVQTVWLREVYDAGLVGSGRDDDVAPCIAVVQLDRVATIVRLHIVFGFDVDTIAMTLEGLSSRWQ